MSREEPQSKVLGWADPTSLRNSGLKFVPEPGLLRVRFLDGRILERLHRITPSLALVLH